MPDDNDTTDEASGFETVFVDEHAEDDDFEIPPLGLGAERPCRRGQLLRR